MISFDGQVAIVTGSGGGIGKAYALELGRRGARVIVNDLGTNPDGTGSAASAAEATVAEITAAGGVAVASTDSVATREGGEAIVGTALKAFGRVDILIHNAGILRDKSFAKLEPADLEAILDVHLRGAFFVGQPVYRQMKDQGYGRLLFTTSVAGLFGQFGQTNYAAAKMGLVGLSNVLALEGAKAGITSNVIAPTARTRLTSDLMGEGLGIALEEDLVVPMAIYLVSRDCTLTHEVFAAGGGWYARVFVGLTPGWSAGKGNHPTAEDVHAHIGEIRSEDGYIVPTQGNDILEPMLKAQSSA